MIATALDRTETEAELGKLFKKITLAECKLIRACLQSIADERNDALGRVAELEAEQRLRPMSEAPTGGGHILLFRLDTWENGWSIFQGIGWFDRGRWWIHAGERPVPISQPDAWISLPKHPSRDELEAVVGQEGSSGILQDGR